MKQRIKKILKYLLIFLIIAMTVLYLISKYQDKKNTTQAMKKEYENRQLFTFGIKYTYSTMTIEDVFTNRNLKEISILKSLFIRAYNENAKNKSVESEAYLENDRVVLGIDQISWNSTWYTEIELQALIVDSKHFRIIVSFDMIYGPTEDIYLERFQGELAKEAIRNLIKDTLLSMSEKTNMSKNIEFNKVEGN